MAEAAAGSGISDIKARYLQRKAAALQDLAGPKASARSVRPALKRLAHLADECLRELWAHAGLGAPLALAAVGGFGRGELFPFSDVDVLVLAPDGQSPDADPACRSRIEAFISSCWDCGLDIGSSVRMVSECIDEAAKDVTVQTSLLESRCIAGDSALCRAPGTA